MNDITATPAMTRERSADARIDAAILELAAEGGPFNHDDVARRSRVSRRTVYRRCADQKALRRRLWEQLSPPGGMPRDLGAILDHELHDTFVRFDRHATAAIVATASAEGRQMRLDNRDERVAAYRAMFAPFTDALPEKQREQATAVMQVLCTGLAWREMRDQWGLAGPDAAEASLWALKVLLGHLAREGAEAFEVADPLAARTAEA